MKLLVHAQLSYTTMTWPNWRQEKVTVFC